MLVLGRPANEFPKEAPTRVFPSPVALKNLWRRTNLPVVRWGTVKATVGTVESHFLICVPGSSVFRFQIQKNLETEGLGTL